MSAADWLRGLVVEGPFPPRRAVACRTLLMVAILVSAGIVILDTVPDPWGEWEGVGVAVRAVDLALLERRPRTATVRAMSRCQLLILDAHDFHKFAAAYPNLMEGPQATARARLAGQGPSHGTAA